MNSDLKRSIFALGLTSVLLATSTMVFSLLVDRHFDWNGAPRGDLAIDLDQVNLTASESESANREAALDRMEKDFQSNLLEIEEPGRDLMFPVGVEEAMYGEAINGSPSMQRF